MTPLDWILSAVGLVLFGLFVGVIALYVPHIDLLGVIAIAFLMAVYDFWIRPLQHPLRKI